MRSVDMSMRLEGGAPKKGKGDEVLTERDLLEQAKVKFRNTVSVKMSEKEVQTIWIEISQELGHRDLDHDEEWERLCHYIGTGQLAGLEAISGIHA